MLTNAIKFSPSGSTVHIGARDMGALVEFSVKDSGRGVPESERQSIFLPYRQVSREDATERGGTGLGLAICKIIVEAHGGTISVSSTDGSGSEFFFSVPKASQAASKES